MVLGGKRYGIPRWGPYHVGGGGAENAELGRIYPLYPHSRDYYP